MGIFQVYNIPIMALNSFSTWSALKDYIADQMANYKGGVRTLGVDGKTITYGNFAELREAYEYANYRAGLENELIVTRAYARQGGRGS